MKIFIFVVFLLALLTVSTEKIRGVNLGGWLLLEPWITPSLFEQFNKNSTTEIVDEYTFCKILGHDKAKKVLKKHWDTFCTKNDIKELSEMGINHIRIPVGYWMLDIQDDEPWVSGSWDYLLKSVEWAREYKLKVIIDLHGAPGSQNGFDNSGVRGDINWPCCNLKNIKRTLGVLNMIAAWFGQKKYEGVVDGINLVNEPFFTQIDILKDFYIEGYHGIRRAENKDLSVTISDSFRWVREWEGFMRPPQFEKVYLDTHIYHVFNHDMLRWNQNQHFNFTCTVKRPELIRSNHNLWTYVGEWSLATTDCTKWLNGYGRGARFDGTFGGQTAIGTCVNDSEVRTFTPEYRNFLKKFAEIQMSAYESASGWFFWNFKAEKSPQWDYMQGVREGWIPRNHNSRTYHC